MGKRGPKPGFNPKHRISEKWSSELAYAIGLLATDGCLATRQTLIDLTSKDEEQLKNFIKCIGIPLKIGKKSSGHNDRTYLRVQFKNVLFYNFLLSIGLTPAKSKTMGSLKIPKKYFFDFLRGAFDGDGCTYSYWDKRWRSSFMYYVCFASASPTFLNWLRSNIETHLHVRGHVTDAKGYSTSQLKYAKGDGLKILKKMYATPKKSVFLSRKYLKIQQMLSIVGERL
ncbi:hypothetical protein A2765_02560 [Candidatus Kaiserbacteria bacterium RIFCSPHIGHO2_01_FULL_56_24]|uniref:DOD-type homing endonuclease domain-containing protein n=1 Tax=Candidatus Kaiserbacteria bacterium RIFCSPHIGHO2_01_FULL_56_24 TaxID=1798487 RepID=A0A1F6DB47_9BACT|nr:MAG: hypothetical protein A2765_02560 [Candidatus Kaiserbacteria bacterium RIFCSPHIGHO2_01_FULL_56_24]